MHSWSAFGVWMNHKQTWTHKTHHNPNLGEAPTFPHIIFFVPGHMATHKCHFVLRLSSGNPEILKIGTFVTLTTHNFVCRPLIKVRFEEKLYPLSRSFQLYVARHMQVRESGQFLNFSGRESNWPFF
jgi:hypothetical protein